MFNLSILIGIMLQIDQNQISRAFKIEFHLELYFENSNLSKNKQFLNFLVLIYMSLEKVVSLF